MVCHATSCNHSYSPTDLLTHSLIGQDQTAVIKRRLQALLPGAPIFLDVEDLEDISKLEEYVEQSTTVLIFVSRGYFLSRNCMREVFAAVEMNKPIVLVHEEDPAKGGAPLATLKQECPEEVREAVFGPLDAPRRVIPWLRIESFQLESLEQIAENALHHLPKYVNLDNKLSLFTPGQVNTFTWHFKHTHKLYASQNNPGATEVARRLASFAEKDALHVPTDEELKTWSLSIAVRLPPKKAKLKALGSRGDFSWADTKKAPGSPDGAKLAGKRSAPKVASKLSALRAMTAATAVAKNNSRKMNPNTQGGHGPPPSDVEAPPLSEQLTAEQSAALLHAPVFAADRPYFLLYLNEDTFVGPKGDALADEVRHVLGLPGSGHSKGSALVPIIMVHERDLEKGGCEFDRFFHVTPKDLVVGGLFKAIAVSRYAALHEPISCAEICRAMGLQKRVIKLTSGPSTNRGRSVSGMLSGKSMRSLNPSGSTELSPTPHRVDGGAATGALNVHDLDA